MYIKEGGSSLNFYCDWVYGKFKMQEVIPNRYQVGESCHLKDEARGNIKVASACGADWGAAVREQQWASCFLWADYSHGEFTSGKSNETILCLSGHLSHEILSYCCSLQRARGFLLWCFAVGRTKRAMLSHEFGAGRGTLANLGNMCC